MVEIKLNNLIQLHAISTFHHSERTVPDLVNGLRLFNLELALLVKGALLEEKTNFIA